MPETPQRRPGLFVVERDGTMNGIQPSTGAIPIRRPGHIRRDGGEAKRGYMFLPRAWRRGYAAEACAAVDWFAAALPGESVLLSTQTANGHSGARRPQVRVHRGAATPRTRRRAVARRMVPGHSVKVSSPLTNPLYAAKSDD